RSLRQDLIDRSLGNGGPACGRQALPVGIRHRDHSCNVHGVTAARGCHRTAASVRHDAQGNEWALAQPFRAELVALCGQTPAGAAARAWWPLAGHTDAHTSLARLTP